MRRRSSSILRNPARISSLMTGLAWTCSQNSSPDLRSLSRISFDQLLPLSVRLGRSAVRAPDNLVGQQNHVLIKLGHLCNEVLRTQSNTLPLFFSVQGRTESALNK